MAPATRLLYVDDETTLLEIAKIFLEAKGDFIVDTLTSAKEALAVLNTVEYDAIISDYQMPNMDGITFLKQLKASGNTTPFIIFTGRGREEIVIQALNEGADFYLQKGGEPKSQFAELSHKIHQAVQQKRAIASIRNLERREADIINFLPDATFAIDTQGVVIAWNRAMEKMTGVAPDRILGKGNFEYSIPFYHERRPILIDLVLKDDPITAGKYPSIKRDGITLFSEITIPHFNNGGGAALWFTATPLYDTRGNIIGAIESIREVTERVQVKEALRESEKRFRELSDLLPLIIYETDTCGNLTYANRIAFEQFGYSEEEFRQGLNVIQMLVPFDHERAAAALRAMFEGREKTEPVEEYLAIRKDGSTFQIAIYSSPVFVNDRVTGLRGIIIDVTERKRGEDAIHESEKRYRNVVEDQTEFISRFLPDGTHIFVNEAYCRYFGLKRDDILGKRFQPDIPDNDKARVKRFFKSLTPDHPVDIIEHRIIMKDGSIRWQRWSDRAIFDNAGKITEYQSVGRDVTDKKDAEFALQASEERYRSIVNDQTELIARFTPDGVITFVNETYRSFFAPLLDLHEIEGKTIWDIMQVTNYPEVKKFLSSLTQQTPIREMERVFTTKDGNKYWQIWAVRALFDNDGNPVEYQVVGRDITKRKRAEEALRENEEKFRVLSEQSILGIGIIQDGIYQYFNQGYCAISGYSVDEIRSWKPYEYAKTVHPDDLDFVMEQVQKKQTNSPGGVTHYSFHAINKDGAILLLDLYSKCIEYQGRPADFVMFIDITERKRAEEALARSEICLRRAERVAGFGHWEFNLDTKEVHASDGARTLYGLANRDWSIPEVQMVPLPEYRPMLDEALQALVENNREYDVEFRIKRPSDGKVVDIHSIAEYDEKTRVVFGVIHDISGRRQAEEALKENEQKFRTLVEYSLEGSIIVDFQGKILFTNNAAARMIEAEGDAGLIGRNVMEFIATESKQDVMRDFEHVARGHDAFLAHYHVISVKGKKIYVESIGKVIPYEGKTADLISIRDITEQKNAENELRESEQKYRILLDGALDPIFSFYPDGTYHYVNRAFAEGVGKSVDQIIGKKIWDVFPKDEAEKRFSTLRSVFSTGEGKEFEVRVPRPDGDRYYVTTIVPIKDDKGSVVSAICSSKEITARKKVEEALREREEKYRHLIENSHDIIYTMTPLGEFIYVSPSWTLHLGHPVTEVVGKSFLQFVHPDDMPVCMDFLKKTIEDGIRQPYVEYRVQHADGSWRWHISKSVPLRDETGRILGFEGIASDITGRKQAEEALQQANKKLNLLSSITRHDINNQLLALNGFLELLHEKIQNPAFEEYFDRIEQASTGISTMIEFTREYEMIGVAALIWHTCRTLVDTVSKDAPLGKVVMKNDLPSSLEVFADPLITRVYYNLMDNAARYGGSITSIRFYVKECDGNQIIVCEDDGDGVPAEEKERIFNRGFGRNTGMGLYLTREILSITGITIRETGVQGKGGRFEITVPKGAYRFNKK